jgi:hypothetical protein
LKRNSESLFLPHKLSMWEKWGTRQTSTRSASSSLTPGRPLFFSGHKQPVATNFLCQW